MCYYQYVYYSRCRHGDMFLRRYCDDAYAYAGMPPPDRANAPGGAQPPPQHNNGLAPSNSGSQDAENCLREEETNTKESEPEDEADHSLRQHTAGQVEAPQQQAPPPTTWASVVRATEASGSGSVSQAALPKGISYATTTGTQQSPAHRTAARFDNIKMSKSSTELSSSAQTLEPDRGKRVGSGSSRSALTSAPTYGRSARAGSMPESPSSDRTVTVRADISDKKEGRETCIDVRSPTDFPLLSPNSISRSSSTTVRARSLSSASWAQVAGLTNAERSNKGSTTDPAAVSDAGTHSTSLSSFHSDLLDPTIELAQITMAPDRNSTAKTVKLKKPPSANTKLGHTPDSPRKRLPAEWTGSPSSPEKGTAILAKRKSTGSLGRPPKNANEALNSPPKSPTKIVPFELATARRAAVREQKEKTAGTAKVAPAVPKTLPKGKSSMKGHSKTISSDTTSTNQFQTAAPSPFPSSSSQSFATAADEPHHTISAPSSPSRIPRLATRFDHGSATSASELEPSPVRSEVRVAIMVPDTASEPKIDILRTLNPPAPIVEDVGVPDLSVETVKPHEESESTIILESQKNNNIDDARSEMAKSDEAIKNASTAVEEIQHPLYPHVHFVEDEKAAENLSGLRIEYGSPIRQAEANEEPHGFLPAESKIPAQSDDPHPPSTTLSPQPQPNIHEFEACATRRVLDFSGEEADVESLASLKSFETGAAQREGTRSPEMLSTWLESSDITISRGADFQLSEENEEAVSQQSHDEPAPESLVSTEVVVAESSFCKEPSDAFTQDDDLQLSLNSHTGSPSSRASTIRGTNSIQPEHSSHPDPTANFNQGAMTHPGLGVCTAMSRSFQNITTAPSKLNAQAQEFVPSTITSALPGTTFTPGASSHGNARPQIPRKWAHPGTTNSYVEEQTHAKHIANRSHLNSPRDSAPSGKKKNKKKSPKKFSNEFSSDHWGRDFDMQVNATGAPQPPSRQFSGAIAASSGSALAGPPGGGWNMPYIFQGSRPYDGSLQEATNVPYGNRRTASGFVKPVYTGRGGQGMPASKVPAFEEWFSGGWQSINGGPLTHASVYEYLRQQGEPEYWGPDGSFATIYPPARTPTPAGESREYVGNGVLKPCGNRVMEGCYEALPHWPFMCPSCQPEHGPDEW